MRGQRGASSAAVVAVVAALVVAGGTIIFFVATPGGRKMFRSFLNMAAGEEPDEGAEDELDAETLAFLERARRALAQDKLDDAELAANAVLTRESDNAEAKEILRQVELRRQKAEQLRRKTVHDEAVREAGRFLASGDLERAEEFARKALDAVPDSTEAEDLLAKVTEEKERVEAELARRRKQADGFAAQGLAALTAERYGRALALAKQALALDEENATARFVRLQAEFELKRAQGETDDARSDDQKRAAADKFCEIAEMSWQEKEYEDTLHFATKALDCWPAHEKARYLRKKARQKLREAEEARAAEKDEDDKEPAVATEVEQVMAFLEELDRAMMKEDADALARLVSPSAKSGVITGVEATRKQEIENARSFFEVASGIAIERKTRPADVRAAKDLADVLSSYRISFRIGEVSASRKFSARYSLAREAGAWRLRSVTIEDDQP